MPARSVIVHAHAKLNLALHVHEREPSGYHRIESIFCRLELCDDIEVTRIANGIELDVRGTDDEPAPDLGRMTDNLAWRAAALFLEAMQPGYGVRITLTKRIPAGAGLGGGSSDAAAVLDALNRMEQQPRDVGDLMPLAARLGSDVPFFLSGAALAFASGRGEQIEPLEPLPSRPVVLAVPRERVNTTEAYALLDKARGAGHAPADHSDMHVRPRTWDDIAVLAHNDFEEIIFARHPRLGSIRQLLAADAIIARMTGSGSVVFGLYADDDRAARAALRTSAAYPDVTELRTRTAENTNG